MSLLYLLHAITVIQQHFKVISSNKKTSLIATDTREKSKIDLMCELKHKCENNTFSFVLVPNQVLPTSADENLP